MKGLIVYMGEFYTKTNKAQRISSPTGSTATSRACQTISIFKQDRTRNMDGKLVKEKEKNGKNLVVVIEILTRAKIRVGRRSNRLETGHSRKRTDHDKFIARRRTVGRRLATARQGTGRKSTMSPRLRSRVGSGR